MQAVPEPFENCESPEIKEPCRGARRGLPFKYRKESFFPIFKLAFKKPLLTSLISGPKVLDPATGGPPSGRRHLLLEEDGGQQRLLRPKAVGDVADPHLGEVPPYASGSRTFRKLRKSGDQGALPRGEERASL